jgi:hypothetical protein
MLEIPSRKVGWIFGWDLLLIYKLLEFTGSSVKISEENVKFS